jgi:hypothetical protein
MNAAAFADLSLSAHPDMPSGAVRFIGVQLQHKQRGLHLHYVVEGDAERIVLPPPQKPYRADELWQTTCFEFFVHDSGDAYREFNFSPSSQWAAYAFTGYRAGREALALNEPPTVRSWPESNGLLMSVSLPVDIPPGARIGLCAVIEETDGTKSYWALAHPPGPPDFHHPDSFAIELAAAYPSAGTLRPGSGQA